MLKTKKLRKLAQQELEALRNLLPNEVKRDLQPLKFVYVALFGANYSPYSIYVKNNIATPYSKTYSYYVRSRATKFNKDTKLFSALDYYLYNCSNEEREEIYQYLTGEIKNISL